MSSFAAEVSAVQGISCGTAIRRYGANKGWEKSALERRVGFGELLEGDADVAADVQ